METTIKVDEKIRDRLLRIKEYYGFSSVNNLLETWIERFDSFEIKVKLKKEAIAK